MAIRLQGRWLTVSYWGLLEDCQAGNWVDFIVPMLGVEYPDAADGDMTVQGREPQALMEVVAEGDGIRLLSGIKADGLKDKVTILILVIARGQEAVLTRVGLKPAVGITISFVSTAILKFTSSSVSKDTSDSDAGTLCDKSRRVVDMSS